MGWFSKSVNWVKNTASKAKTAVLKVTKHERVERAKDFVKKTVLETGAYVKKNQSKILWTVGVGAVVATGVGAVGAAVGAGIGVAAGVTIGTTVGLVGGGIYTVLTGDPSGLLIGAAAGVVIGAGVGLVAGTGIGLAAGVVTGAAAGGTVGFIKGSKSDDVKTKERKLELLGKFKEMIEKEINDCEAVLKDLSGDFLEKVEGYLKDLKKEEGNLKKKDDQGKNISNRIGEKADESKNSWNPFPKKLKTEDEVEIKRMLEKYRGITNGEVESNNEIIKVINQEIIGLREQKVKKENLPKKEELEEKIYEENKKLEEHQKEKAEYLNQVVQTDIYSKDLYKIISQKIM